MARSWGVNGSSTVQQWRATVSLAVLYVAISLVYALSTAEILAASAPVGLEPGSVSFGESLAGLGPDARVAVGLVTGAYLVVCSGLVRTFRSRSSA